MMQRYDFEIQRNDETIAAVRSVELPGPGAIWLRVSELAQNAFASGCRIRVTNQTGEIVLLIGVAAARLSFPHA